MSYRWLPDPQKPTTLNCYRGDRAIGWVECESDPPGLSGDPLLPPTPDGLTNWYGWQVGTGFRVVACGVSRDARAAEACVEAVASACGWEGYDDDGEAWWAPPIQ